MVGLQRFSEAEKTLVSARQICDRQPNVGCVWMLGLASTLAQQQGKLDQANQFAKQALASARRFHAPMSEASSLLRLGHLSLQQERYDEALDWSSTAIEVASPLKADDILQNAKGNLAWAYFRLGDSERALALLDEARTTATSLGDTSDSIAWLIASGYIHAAREEIPDARLAYDRAMAIARQANSKEAQPNILTDLGLVSLAAGDARQAGLYADQALSIAREDKSLADIADASAVLMQAAALQGNQDRAEQLLHDVEAMPDSLASMKWASQHALASLYNRQGKGRETDAAFQKALATFEGARTQIQHDSSQLPFVANATAIYDDYIRFLINQHKPEQALMTADQSRARALAQGLGLTLGKPSMHPAMEPEAIARKAHATLLFYWLGAKQSWLWVVSPRQTSVFPLPSVREILPRIERYRRTLQGPTDPLRANDEDGLALYNTLVAPAAPLLPPDGNVMILADGALSLINFETLIVPARAPVAVTSAATPAHYWIEDVNLVSAPSLSMLASARPGVLRESKLLLLGDAISPEPIYPELPLAAKEMQQIQKHFAHVSKTVFARQQANPSTYLASMPQQFSYIHFVAHGVASRTDPLDSAIILSRSMTAARNGEDSFKLYARDIMRHPIDARLVTISACYGSGTRSYFGEGLVGLSWAFLRAGAHNTIGALWEASDDSTPLLMDSLYTGLEQGQSPAAALRNAKLALLHSSGVFKRPFYWAPFQMYTRL